MRPELETAVRAVEACSGASKRRVTRHEARPVLLGIGECLIEGRTPEAEDALARLRRLPAELREAFDAAVRDELEMACSEHVRSVDPRYLQRPDYDLAYTVAARHRLECRLRAAERLGIDLAGAWLENIRRADALLGRRQDIRETTT